MTKDVITPADIYNNFAFEWLFMSDSVKWQSPAHLMLGETSLYESGDHLSHRMSVKNLEKRFTSLHEAVQKREPYKVQYELQVQSNKIAKVEEQGRVFFNAEGEMLLCRGYVHTLDVREQENNEVISDGNLIKELETAIKQSADGEQSSFMYVCIDRLPLIAVEYGYTVIEQLMDQIEGVLKGIIRDYDILGRMSGTSFGLILNKCSHSEIIIIAKKIIEALDNEDFDIDDEEIELSASIGGCSIKDSGEASVRLILNHCERALLDAQHIKKIAVPTSHMADQIEGSQGSKKRRLEDAQQTDKKTKKAAKQK